MSVPGRKAGQLGAPRNMATDEELHVFCQSCTDEGQQVPAAGFCVDCCEYLCKKCYEHHRTPRQLKHHVLQDKKTMPRSRPPNQRLEENINQCPQHPGEAITFKCRSHDQLLCGICIAIEHLSCDGISYVETEYEDLETKLNDLEQLVDSNTRKTEKNVADIDTYYPGAVESIGQFRKEIHEFLDKLQHEIINETNRIHKEDQVNMTSISAKLDDMRSEIHSTISDLSTLHTTQHNGKLFTAMDKTKLEMQKLEDRLTQIQADNTIKRYRFEPEKQIKYVMGNVAALGNISLMNEPYDNEVIQLIEPKESKTTKPPEQPNDSKATQTEILNYSKMTQTEIPIDRKTTEIGAPVLLTATHKTDIYIKSAKYESNCWITGSAILPDNQLVISDYNNNKVKLVDTKRNKITAEIRLSSGPWDITTVNNTEVAVTIPARNKIRFLLVVFQSLSKCHGIKVNGQCHGIAHNDKTLIVTFVSPGKVEIINMTGTVLKRVMNDASNKQLFGSPHYIAISPDKTAMYVSDFNKHTVTCIAMDGTVKAVYKDDNLKYPYGLAVDRTGTVYVCGYSSHSIHTITADCTKIQTLLRPEHGLSLPYSITYCDMKDKLYVGMNLNQHIKVYQLK